MARYKQLTVLLEEYSHKDIFKALCEREFDYKTPTEEELDSIYDEYMEVDEMTLLSRDILDLIYRLDGEDDSER